MKHRGMKILSLLLTLALVLGLMPGMSLTAYAATTFTSLSNGDVIKVGDTLNSTTEYGNSTQAWFMGPSATWTLVRADITEGQFHQVTVTENNDGAYYTFKSVDKSNGNVVFLDIPLPRVSVTNTSDGVVVSRPGNNYTITFAVHEVEGYTVTFDPGEGRGTMADVTGVSGEYTLPGCGFDPPEGKSFKAWRMDGTEYAPGDKINIGRNTTFVAVWQAASSGGAGFGFGGGDESWSGGYVTGQRAYRVSLAPMQGGSAALVLNTGESGEALNVYPQTTVRVVPSPAPGYKLASIVWSLIDGSASYDITQSQTFVTPAMDAVVHVTFVPMG